MAVGSFTMTLFQKAWRVPSVFVMNDQTQQVTTRADRTPVLAGSVAPHIPDHHLLRVVGQGAYGEVWLAQNVIGTFRAVKVVYRRTFSDDRPYEREFNGIKKFEPVSRTHPSLVNVLHIGRNNEAGLFYYVMEIADDTTLGQDLRPEFYVPKTLHHELAARGRLPAAECLRLGLLLASALGHLHQSGLIHRDIKPSNVIFIAGVPKLADIGLVTSIGEQASQVGTEGYFPLEGGGTVAADVFSLGMVLYEMSTGLDRFKFPSLPTNLREFPDAPLLARLNQIILKACDSNGRRRFQSANEMHVALSKLREASGATNLVVVVPPSRDKSVAVLPFVNMSADRENEYLSDGITEDVIAALAQVKGLRVAGRTSAFALKGKAKDIRRIAEQLGVRTVVEGSVQKSGNQLRITAQLINAADGCLLWGQQYNRQMKDVFDLQDEISRAVVSALKVRLTGDDTVSLVKPQTVSTQAYQLYLQGRYFWNQRGESLKKGMHYFELALLEDPDYALAHAGLADSYNLLGFYGYVPPREAVPKGKIAALRAVELDPDSAEAHNSLGFSQLIYDWDFPAAIAEFRRALEIDANYSPARYWLASYLSAIGRHEEAIAEDLRALEVDPMSVFVRTHLGWTYLHARQYEKVFEPCRAALELNPNFLAAHWVMGRAFAAQSRFSDATREFEKLLSTPPMNTWGLAWLANTCVRIDQPERAAQFLDELQRPSRRMYVRAYLLAVVHVALGRMDETFAWLRKSHEERDVWLGWIKCDPNFDQIQTDPRFVELWRSLGLD